MSYKPGIIIQARTGSSRLPDKVVRPFHKGKSILELLTARFNNKPDYRLIVATTNETADNRICEICRKEGIPFYRGSADNVLERFYLASDKFMIDPIIRVCADNPFLLESSPSDLLAQFKKDSSDYIGYRLSDRRIGIKTHFGLWAELLTRDSISRVLKQTVQKTYLEHVTNFLYEEKNGFRISLINAPDIVYSRKDIRLTIDSESDFLLGKEIYRQYYDGSREKNLESLIELVDRHPEWKKEMSKSISQNEK